ncbi:MAG: 30S ribosomal protein S8 [Bacteriovoracaceae bacterium]|nr:30S ribosomal protein S8 [Halobacteriovoraceae bacterium]MDP7321742.1 30S ribosomal protein S8 [Bacteriovoracaceae bacterium]
MMMTDPVADMLTRLRNGASAGHSKVDMPASKIKANICKVLKEEGFIKNFKVLVKDNNLVLRVALKEGAIVGIQRVSKPGLRVYKGYRSMPRVLSGLGVSVVSTSSGIVSSRKAKAMKLGGEVLCNVW